MPMQCTTLTPHLGAEVTGIDLSQPLDPQQGNPEGAQQAARVAALLRQFGEKNPGTVRRMVGDALAR